MMNHKPNAPELETTALNSQSEPNVQSETSSARQLMDDESARNDIASSGSLSSPSPEEQPVKTKEALECSEENEGGEIPEYPDSWKFAVILMGLCLSVFCVALDNTIMATVIPKITDEFNSLDDVGWYGSSYLLTTCALTLMFGKLYTFYSIKWVYLVGLAVFEVGSLICGIAPNSTSLIIGRAIAGLGSAGLFSGCFLIIAQTVPLERRPVITGLIGGLYGIASVAGPLLGGLFTDYASWRWCFYINLPLGGVTALFILLFYKAPPEIKQRAGRREQVAELDLLGTIFFLPAIICLLLALQWGGTKYSWANGHITGLFVAFGVLVLVFAGVQWRQQGKATLPPALIKNRNVWGAALYAFCVYSSFTVYTYYLPIWFQSINGVSATKSGIMNLPMLIGVTVSSILAGAIVSRFGYYAPFMFISPVIASVGGGLLTTLQVDSDPAKWIGYQALYGIGAGLGMQIPVIAVQATLPSADLPSATVIVLFMQTIGGSIFVSVAQNIFHNRLLRNCAVEAPSVDAGQMAKAGATMLRDVVSPEVLPAVLRAYNSAITQALYISVAMIALAVFGALPVRWVSLKGRQRLHGEP